MRRVILLAAYVMCLAGCKSPAPPPPANAGGVNVDVPFVKVQVPADGLPTVKVGPANVNR